MHAESINFSAKTLRSSALLGMATGIPVKRSADASPCYNRVYQDLRDRSASVQFTCGLPPVMRFAFEQVARGVVFDGS